MHESLRDSNKGAIGHAKVSPPHSRAFRYRHWAKSTTSKGRVPNRFLDAEAITAPRKPTQGHRNIHRHHLVTIVDLRTEIDQPL